MGEKLLINVTAEETRVALVEGGHLNNVEIDTRRQDQRKGNVYKGIIHRVNASLQAAFVDYGEDKQGFLPLSEIHPRYYPPKLRGKKVPIQEVLQNRQELMVQVVKDELGNKGAALTTHVSLPGRYLVLIPKTDKSGISRRLPSDERSRLKKIINGLDVPDEFGVIVRTAGVEREAEDFEWDLEALKRHYSALQTRFDQRRNAGLIHQERSVALRFIRDYANSDLEEIICDDRGLYEEVRDYCTILMPEMRARLKHYTDPTPLYSRYQVEDQIDDVFARRIDMPAGGYIIIDQTEALVAVDVNSGRVKTNDIEKTALKTNLEAAEAIARQLKLRDMGGLVIVDFIDMREKANVRAVERAAMDAFADDKAKVKFSRISDFGLMEISRQRLKSAIVEGSFQPCVTCGGTGQTRSVASSSIYTLRRLKAVVLRASYSHVSVRMPVAVANYLHNNKRRELLQLEIDCKATIIIRGEPKCMPSRAFADCLTTSAGGKRPRRILYTFDFVRSEVNKEELGDDIGEILVEAVEARGMSLKENEFEAIYREIESRMAKDADVLREQIASQQQQAVESALAEAAKRAAEAEAQRVEEATPTGGFVAWIKRLLNPAPPVEALPPAPVEVVEAPTGRNGRRPASERLRDRNRGHQRRAGKEMKTDGGRRNSDGDGDGERRRGDGRRSEGKRGDGRRNEGKRGDGRRSEGKRGDGRRGERGEREERPKNEAVDGDGDGDGRRRRRRGGKGRSGGREDGGEATDAPKAAEAAPNRSDDDAGTPDNADGTTASAKRRRRRRRRSGGDDDGAVRLDGSGAVVNEGGSMPEPAAKPKAEAKPKPEAAAKPKAEAKPKPEAAAKPTAEAAAKPTAEAAAKPKAEAAAKPKPEAKPKAEAAAKPKPEAAAKPKAEAAAKPKSEAAATSRPAAPARPKAPAKTKED